MNIPWWVVAIAVIAIILWLKYLKPFEDFINDERPQDIEAKKLIAQNQQDHKPMPMAQAKVVGSYEAKKTFEFAPLFPVVIFKRLWDAI
jgi:hypothetical protein